MNGQEHSISKRRTFTVVGAIHLVRPSSPARCRKRNSDPDNHFLPMLSSMARPIAPSLLPSHPLLPPALITLPRVSRAGNSIQTLLLTKLKLALSAVGEFRRSSPNTLPAWTWQLGECKTVNLLCLLHNPREALGESAVPHAGHSFYFQAHLQKITSVCRRLALQRCD